MKKSLRIAFATALAGSAAAQAPYPSRPITMVVGFAPAKTPKEILVRLNQELVKVLAAPEVREQLLSHGLEPMPGTSEALAKYIEREYATWGRVVREAKITANSSLERS